VQTLLDLEDELPGRVTRDPLTTADAARGYTGGVITALDLRLINLTSTRLEAYDVQADYAWRNGKAGDFRFYLIATWQPHLERQAVSGSSFTDYAGYNLGLLTSRNNGGLTWTKGPWMLGWNGQYYDSYFVYTATNTPAQIASAVLNQGSDRIPHQMYHDLVASYRFPASRVRAKGLLADTEIAFGLKNAFDTDPPIVATVNSAGGASNGFSYSTYGDPRLRRFTLIVRKHF
jgi:iron complex outermembrane recepter protein